MLNSNLCPEAESKIFTQIVETIANLDVDIRVRLRKGTHLEKFNNLGSSSHSEKKASL